MFVRTQGFLHSRLRCSPSPVAIRICRAIFAPMARPKSSPSSSWTTRMGILETATFCKTQGPNDEQGPDWSG